MVQIYVQKWWQGRFLFCFYTFGSTCAPRRPRKIVHQHSLNWYCKKAAFCFIDSEIVRWVDFYQRSYFEFVLKFSYYIFVISFAELLVKPCGFLLLLYNQYNLSAKHNSYWLCMFESLFEIILCKQREAKLFTLWKT